MGDLQAVTTYYTETACALLPNRRIGLLHGKLKPKEKDDVMQRFKAGELDVLVSTTVIEVGVDVPNATVMVIENAERFGLSALHQLRGRVGRGAADSCCILISDNGNDAVRERLQFLCRTSDGFAWQSMIWRPAARVISLARRSTVCDAACGGFSAGHPHAARCAGRSQGPAGQGSESDRPRAPCAVR